MTPDVYPPLSVLVVEDHQDVATTTAELLELRGHKVRIADSGPKAVEAVEADPPDVVLLDIGLPGMNGWEVAERLRKSDGKRPVVVAVTARGADEDRERSAEVGVDLHLVKPVEPLALTSLLNRLRIIMAARQGGSGSDSLSGSRKC